VRDLISVMIPAFNAGSTIGDTLDSVSRQSYRPIEVIVINDGSTDDTEAVFRRWCDSIDQSDLSVIYARQPNAGLLAARQSGIQHSTGRYLQFLDADDILHREKLTRSAAAMKSPEVDVVVSRTATFRTLDGIADSLRNAPRVTPWTTRELHRMTITRGFWYSAGPLFTRRLINNVGAFPSDVHPVAEELEFHGRIKLSRPRIYFLGELLNFYRIGRTDSLTGSLRNVYAGRIACANAAAKLLIDHRERSPKEWRSLLTMCLQTHYRIVNCLSDSDLRDRSWQSMKSILAARGYGYHVAASVAPRTLAEWCCRATYRLRS